MNKPTDIDPVALFQRVVENNSTATLILIVLAAGTWLVGGNLLVAMHYRRMGKSACSGFKPFTFPFMDFNAKEWGILVLLATISFAFMAMALLLRTYPKTT